MDDQGFTLLVPYIRLMADHVGGMGIDVDRLLRQSGLSREQLDDPSLVVTFPTFRKLVVNALALSGVRRRRRTRHG